MTCVKLILPPRERLRWLLITTRLSASSLAGTARTLVAVGTVSEVCMLTTTRAAAPRKVTLWSPPGDVVPDLAGAVTVGAVTVGAEVAAGAAAAGADGVDPAAAGAVAAGVAAGVVVAAGAGTGALPAAAAASATDGPVAGVTVDAAG